MITYNGLTLTVRDWAMRTNQTPFTLRYRLDAGWPIKDALYAPVHKTGPKRVLREKYETRERRFRGRADGIQDDFTQLVREIDRALTVFDRRIKWMIDEPEQTPGVVPDLPEKAHDQSIPSAQDRS